MMFVRRLVSVFWHYETKTIVMNYCGAVQQANNTIESSSSDLDTNNNEENAWDLTPYSDLEDCEHRLGLEVMRTELIFLLVAFSTQVYFMGVLWQYVRNAGLGRAQGGC